MRLPAVKSLPYTDDLPAFRPVADNFYAVTALRAGSDREHELALHFLNRFPEYSRLPHSALMQYAATYRDEGEHAVRRLLADEGVPVDSYHREDDDLAADDAYGSDYS